jgi:hypothetical protein
MPAAWNAGGGQSIVTFQVSSDNVTFMDLFDQHGQEVYAVVNPNTVVMIQQAQFLGTPKIDTYIKVRAGSRDNPVNQSAARVFTFVMG